MPAALLRCGTHGGGERRAHRGSNSGCRRTGILYIYICTLVFRNIQNGRSMAGSIFLLVFVALVAMAAWRDIATMLIPNWISIALGLAFVPAALSAGMSWSSIGLALCFGACVLIVCAILFYLSVFGGGDAKLIAAVSLWTGIEGSGWFLAYMAMAGGALAVVLIVLRARKSWTTDRPWARRLLSPEEGAPYAVAIAIGAWLAIPASPVLAPAFQQLVA
jgi:prepilin peptidase CpaA